MKTRATSLAHTEGEWFFDPVNLIVYDGTEKRSEAVAIIEQREEKTEDSDETSANGWVL